MQTAGYIALAIGLIIDLLSLSCGLRSLIGTRYSSGLPLVPLPFYAAAAAWLILPATWLARLPPLPVSEGWTLFLALCGIHLLCQLPGLLARPGSKTHDPDRH